MASISTYAPGSDQLLMGNEAIARGALEAGVGFASAYPGTPSSEIIGSLAEAAKEAGIYAEWSVNEKVALEAAAAASFAGVRAIVAMKQNGVNVASDFLMTLNLTGTNGGLVVVMSDDPSAHSSTNEQDTRPFAKWADLPLLEPATFQEAKDMTRWAFEALRGVEDGLPGAERHPRLPRPRRCPAGGANAARPGGVASRRPPPSSSPPSRCPSSTTCCTRSWRRPGALRVLALQLVHGPGEAGSSRGHQRRGWFYALEAVKALGVRRGGHPQDRHHLASAREARDRAPGAVGEGAGGGGGGRLPGEQREGAGRAGIERRPAHILREGQRALSRPRGA